MSRTGWIVPVSAQNDPAGCLPRRSSCPAICRAGSRRVARMSACQRAAIAVPTMTEAEIDADLKAALAIEWAHYRSIVIQDKIYYANALDEQSKKAFAMAFARSEERRVG